MTDKELDLDAIEVKHKTMSEGWDKSFSNLFELAIDDIPALVARVRDAENYGAELKFILDKRMKDLDIMDTELASSRVRVAELEARNDELQTALDLAVANLNSLAKHDGLEWVARQ